MSGAHSQHRTPNRPLFDEAGNPVYKLTADGELVLRHRLVPTSENVAGRPVFAFDLVPVQRHVLDYSPAPHFPSKNARGRIRPRTAKEQRRAASLQAKFVRISKRVTVAQNQGAMYDEVALAAL